MNPEILQEIMVTKMPYGKYKDTLLYQIPMFYLEWYYKKGFPAGKLGMQLSTVYEIKLNGLEDIFYQLKRL